MLDKDVLTSLNNRLHRCLDFDEIEAWLNDNAYFLSGCIGCPLPGTISISHPESYEPLEVKIDITLQHLKWPESRWTFYLWISNSACRPFIEELLPHFGFHIHWVSAANGIDDLLTETTIRRFNFHSHGVDSYISMIKTDWTNMQICERLKT